MASVIDNIGQFFKRKSILSQLIIINIVVFVLIRLIYLISILFQVKLMPVIQYLGLPASLMQILHKPWTLIAYMFVHYDFLHILFNLLWLYWFGQIFLRFFNSKQLFGTYIIGGIFGALFYIISYNVFPYFKNVLDEAALIGASASVMAIVFASSFYKRDFRVNFFFFGSVRIYYIALIAFLLDFLIITRIDESGNLSENFGGHIAHFGGAFFGVCYALSYQKGKDLTAALNKCIDWTVNLFKKKPFMRVSYQKRESEYKYNAQKNKNMQELDQILDKIKRSGYDSLTKEEKKKLFDSGQ